MASTFGVKRGWPDALPHPKSSSAPPLASRVVMLLAPHHRHVNRDGAPTHAVGLAGGGEWDLRRDVQAGWESMCRPPPAPRHFALRKPDPSAPEASPRDATGVRLSCSGEAAGVTARSACPPAGPPHTERDAWNQRERRPFGGAFLGQSLECVVLEDQPSKASPIQ